MPYIVFRGGTTHIIALPPLYQSAMREQFLILFFVNTKKTLIFKWKRQTTEMTMSSETYTGNHHFSCRWYAAPTCGGGAPRLHSVSHPYKWSASPVQKKSSTLHLHTSVGSERALNTSSIANKIVSRMKFTPRACARSGLPSSSRNTSE